MNKKLALVLILFGILAGSCTRQRITKNMPDDSASMKIASPPCIIYKTRSDYNNLVPVILTHDKSSISSYPGIKDIYYNQKLSYPAILSNGYLLDNRGIGPDVAFLNITYEDYSRMEKTPDVAELWKRIIDKDPLVEMYDCGPRSKYADPEAELNEIISSGAISKFKKLK